MNKIFISSTFTDLEEYRTEVIKIVRQLGAIDISMEDFGARDERPKEECLKLIKNDSDVFIGIYAHRYGFIPPGESISITEMEYNEAARLAKPRFLYTIDEKTPWIPEMLDQDKSKIENLKKRLQLERICKKFKDKYHLAASVSADLGRHFLQDSFKDINATSKQNGLKKLPSDQESWTKERNQRYSDNKNIFLVHTLWPSDKPGQEYDIYIYLIGHKTADLSKIKYAEFFLGKFWKNAIYKVQNENNKIGIYTSAYGPFLCVCKIVFDDGNEIIIDRYIDFEHGKLIGDLHG